MPSITVPPAKNYGDPLVAVPSRAESTPREGNKQIDCQINWGVTDNGMGAVNFNLQNNATLEFSQICAIIVDNSVCGADIQFIFPDTGVTISIPAYLPYAVVPVFSNQVQFFVSLEDSAIVGDITRFSMLNFDPPPVTVPATVHQNAAAIGVLQAGGAAVQTIIAAGISGTLENLQVFYSTFQVTTNFTQNWIIKDGNGNVVAAGQMSQIYGGSLPYNNILFNANAVALRFVNGLKLYLDSTVTAIGNYSVNAYYRTP